MKTIISIHCLFWGILLAAISRSFAQDSLNNEFTIGAFVGQAYDNNIYNSFMNSGMNTIVHRVNSSTQPYLTNYKVIASNAEPNDWIHFYVTGYYSKWEAEENQTNISKVGVKHKYGIDTTFNGFQCWSTKGMSRHGDSLVYGPHYRQWKKYKRNFTEEEVLYTTRFRMALDYDSAQVNPNEEVCRISIKVRYVRIINGVQDSLFDEILSGPRTLKVSDFTAIGEFQNFSPPNYNYLSKISQKGYEEKINVPNTESDTTYSDINGDNGIQFCVEWLRDDALCTLYIDYIEVYDNNGWNQYIDSTTHNLVVSRITNYAQTYDWDNIIYWYGHDEPSSLDAYTPIKTVNEILQNSSAPQLISAIYPTWRIYINSDSQLVRYYNTVKPKKLMIDYYPFSPVYDPIRWEDLESTREQFQIAASLQPGFWYVAQGFGIWDLTSNNWCVWRKPSSSELKATIMLALAHGSNGILFWNYDSYTTDYCDVPGYFDCIIDMNQNWTELWYLIHDNLAPRLKGKLGSTLLRLNYTGEYVFYRNGLLEKNGNNYLSLYDPQIDPDLNFHGGLLESKVDAEEKYFLLTNLNTENYRYCGIEVLNTSGYNNLRLLEVEEGTIDETITSSFIGVVGLEVGDGKLFQAAPVVKYGGKLVADEHIAQPITLNDDMTIEDGATLYLAAEYTANANITVRTGAKIVSENNGLILFPNGHKIIFEGIDNIYGSQSHRVFKDNND